MTLEAEPESDEPITPTDMETARTIIEKRVAGIGVSEPQVRTEVGGDGSQRIVAEGMSVRTVEEIVSLGGDQPAVDPRPTRARRPVAPKLAVLADRLSDRFETRVKVDLGKSKGKITVEFASLDDLRRIVDVMDPRNRDDRPI